MNNKICFLFGNHDTPDSARELLEGSVELHIVDDGVTEFVPKQIAIVTANHYMVDHADNIICYVTHNGNSLLLYNRGEKRAKKGELKIEELYSSGLWIQRYLDT